MKRMTDLVLLVWESGHYQEYEAAAPGPFRKAPENWPHLERLLPEAIAARLVGAVKAALRTGAVHQDAYTLETGDRLEYFQAKAVPLYPQYALLLVENVTEKEETLRALGQEIALLQLVLNNVTTQVSVYDREGNRILQNKASVLHDAFVAGGEATGGDMSILGPEGQPLPAEDVPLVRAFRGEAVLNQVVLERSAAYGTRTYLVNAVPLSEEAGITTGVLLTERDISDLQKVQTRLQAKTRDFDMFMYRASHDLKSPLAAMEGVLCFAISNVSDPTARMYLELVRKSHSLLADTVNSLVTLTRISQKVIEKRELHLNSLVQEVVETIRLLPWAASIHIHVCAPAAVAVSADEGLLRALLQNLICNALVHHRPEGADRLVKVGISEQAGTVRIEVSDNGPGIPSTLHDKIYDIFFRGNPAVAGAGVGLFIVKQAVEKLAGSIELASEEGAGSTFTVIIPKTAAR